MVYIQATPNIHLIYNENGISTQATPNIHLIYNKNGISTQATDMLLLESK